MSPPESALVRAGGRNGRRAQESGTQAKYTPRACLRPSYERSRMQFVSRLGVGRGANSGRAAGRPGPREVWPPHPAKGVELFPTQKQAGVPTALERPRLHLVQRDATSRDFGLLVAFVAGPWQDEPCQRFKQRGSFGATQFRGAPVGWDACLLYQLFRQSLRRMSSDRRDHEGL